MPKQSHSHTVTGDQVLRADHVVRDLTQLSRSKVTSLFGNGCVKVNGKVCTDSFFRVGAGDTIDVSFNPDSGFPAPAKAWKDRTFDVVFEDSWIIVVNKSAGILSVPTEKSTGNTVLDRLKIYLNHSRSGRECYVVHRLDREASGLLVFAKTDVGAGLLQAQFADNAPERMFTAIVNGNMAESEGRFESRLTTASNLDQYAVYGKDEGQLATTEYRVIREKLDTTVVELKLVTARRHQMRVHLADAGHPILGDPRYGKGKSRHRNWHKRRMALHGHRLEFLHPESATPMVFETPVPVGMKKFRPQPLEE
jgi:23S rRNA pseudouridine1911/1915/1917 synthase